MADNFFDTMEDFFADSDLFALVERALDRPPPMHPDTQEARRLSHLGFLRALEDSPSLFPTGTVQEASVLSSDILSAGSGSSPTRSGPTDGDNSTITVTASPRHDHSPLNTAPRSQEVPSTPAFPPDPPRRSPFTRPTLAAPLTSNRGLPLPLHGLLDLSADPVPRHQSRSDIFPPQRQPRDLARLSDQRRLLHRFRTADLTAPAYHGSALDLARRHTDTSSPDPPTMSTSSRRRSGARAADLALPSAPSRARLPSRPSANPRRSASRPSQPEQIPSAPKRKRETDEDMDLFGDDLFGGAEVVDLVDTDEIPTSILGSQENAKKFVKLSSFDCVICMDSAKDLTVTHCGHLFCSACLHSALNMEVAKRICPICRQKIDRPTAASGKFGRSAKGFFPLELKLMTKKTLGKTLNQSS